MAEVAFIIGTSIIGAVIISKPVSVIFSAARPTEYIKYKYYKSIYKSNIKKAIIKLNYDSFFDEFQKLKLFDSLYGSDKFIKYKQKFGINNEILNNKKLFLIKYDPNYLISVSNTSTKYSEEELEYKTQELIKREQTLNDFENFNTYKNIEDKEKELNDKIQNYLLLLD